MKKLFLLTVFFALFTCHAYAESRNSQHVPVNLNKERVALKDVLNAIEQQTDFLFISNRSIDLKRKVSIKADNMPVKDVLDKLFANTDLGYAVEGVNIILFKKEVAETAAIDATQQARTITGIVVDEKGEPIIGANVIEKGVINGAITDLDGKFSLTVSDDAVIQVTYIGYTTAEVSTKGRSTFNIVLREDATMLDEVLVTVGFGTQKKANLTGALSTVKMDEVLGDRPVVSVNQALQGTMPGLQITTNTGMPGKAMTLNVRGVNRLGDLDDFGNGEPLVLVDNVPMDINMISPADIETVTILKDAASAAIYGARAAFGVVLITTKQGGLERKARINYSNNFSFNTPQSLIQKATPMETVMLYKDMNYGGGKYGQGQDIDTWLDHLKKYESNPSQYPLGYYLDESTGVRYDLKANNHLEDMTDGYGFQQTHNISIDGGTEKTAYRVSFGYMDEDGILVTDKDSYKRYNVSSFLRTEVTPWMDLTADIKYSNAEQSNPDQRTLRNWSPFRLAQLLPTYYPKGETTVGDQTYTIATPEWNIRMSPRTTVQDENIRLFGKATFKIMPGLIVNAEYTYDRTNQSKYDYKKTMTFANGEPATGFTVVTQNGTSTLKKEEYRTSYNAINLYANYDKTIGDHQIGLMGGFNQEYSMKRYLYAQSTAISNPENPSIGGGTGTLTNGDSYDEFAVRGLYYRATYNYKSRYLIETNGRYDGSSKFPKNDRFGFFPSVSAGWRVSEEAFMEPVRDYVDNLKIRASLGQVGNQAIKNYAYLGTMGTGNGWISDGKFNIYRATPGLFSSSFTWEKVETLDIGFDLNMFNSRLELVFDWYRRDTKGMLAPSQELPSVIGGSAPLENSADLRTTGWEVAINWRDRIGNDWRYGVGFNLWDSRSKVTKFDNETGTIYTTNNKAYRVGQYIGEIWGFVTDRYYTEDDFSYINEATKTYTLKEGVPKLSPNIRDPRPGDILYKNLDDDPTTIDRVGAGTVDDPGDRKIIGNTTRRYNYSINANVGWKGFDLSLFFTGVGKRDLWIGMGGTSNFLAWPHTNTDNPGAAATVLKHHLDYWTPDNPNAYYPRLSDQNNIGTGTDSYNRQVQTKYLADGSYIKLKNITLSYTFPKALLNKVKGVNAFKVFFSGEDLWTKHNLFEGMDPEQTFVVNDLYPFMKKISFGINVTL